MTIPDIGHCAGSGAEPIEGTVRDDAASGTSGVCAACSGRFGLRQDGSLSFHDSAEIDEREAAVTDDSV